MESRAAEELQAKLGTTAVGFQCDVSSKDSTDSLVAQVVKQFGGLDVLVANAGIVKTADFLEMSEADFDAVINVNLKGTFLVRLESCLDLHTSTVQGCMATVIVSTAFHTVVQISPHSPILSSVLCKLLMHAWVPKSSCIEHQQPAACNAEPVMAVARQSSTAHAYRRSLHTT